MPKMCGLWEKDRLRIGIAFVLGRGMVRRWIFCWHVPVLLIFRRAAFVSLSFIVIAVVLLVLFLQQNARLA
ncbi:hypothetical protein BDV95DRAFT_578377 [Massariosphaeria phaeospora]|uniref:Uncharacterized protein n=1 Tax=Massariosphaeria phaeospora TaxID=100035 RepID=A0A7C8MGU3_9PLEO|nr:hypothetical protein BDV95DRAFT_578377 [Massariosphaeria phaeospora]